MPPPIPARIDRYEIKGRLGAGGMGVVYLATDPSLRRTVAIKVLPLHDDDLRERFAREARSAAALRHQNVVTIYDVGDDNGQPFIAMEFLDGESISEIVSRRAPLSIDRRLQLLLELCAGLGYAHKNGIVHRDIKPGNLMVTSDGSLKILDFGLARITSEATVAGLTQAGSVLGTPHYMSPEQVEGKVADSRSDIFSVGVVFYELLSYQKAYPGDSVHVVLHNIVHVMPTPIRQLMPSIDADLEAIVNKSLEKDPGKRYQDLSELAADVARIRTGMAADAQFETIIARAPGSPGPPSKPPSGSGGTRTHGPRQLANLNAIAQRRIAQVEAFLTVAAAHFAEGRFSEAIEACENALLLDPDEPRALQLMTQAQASLDEHQLQENLGQARACLSSGDFSRADVLIEQSLKLRADWPEALSLRREVKEQRREHEHAVARAQSAKAAVERGLLRFADSAFDAALRSANEALAYDADDPDALILRDRSVNAIEARRRQEEQDARARELAEQAQAAGADDPAAVPSDEETVQISKAGIAKMLAAAHTTPPAPPEKPPTPPQPSREPAAAPPPAVESAPAVGSESPLPVAKIPPAGIKPMWLGVAAGVILLIGVALWLSMRRAPMIPDAAPPPVVAEAAPRADAARAPVAAESATSAGYQATVESARQRYQARDIDGAVSLALSVPESAPERATAMQLLASMRSDAAARASSERQAAEASPGYDRELLAQGGLKIDEAAAVNQPADTAHVVTLYEEAITLFRQAPASQWSAERLVREARKQYAANRRDAAIDLALQALKRTPDHAEAVELLRSIKNAAADAAVAASRRARTAGVTDTNSAGVREGRTKEAAARALQSPADTKQALSLFDAAVAAYRSASASAVPTPTPPSTPAAPAPGQPKRAEERVTPPVAAPPKPADIQKVISDAARIGGDAEAVKFLTGQQAEYPGNPEIAAALNRRQVARDSRIAELVQRAHGANDEKAIEFLDAALTMDPARSDVRAERERRARAVARPVTEKAVRDGLKKYESAMESRSVTQFINVATYRTPTDIAQEFAAYRSIRLDIEGVSIEVLPDGSAIVRCKIRTIRQPADGRGKPVTESGPWQLKFSKVDREWRITEAAPR